MRFQLADQLAVDHGSGSPLPHRFIKDNPYRTWSTCAAMLAPPDAGVADAADAVSEASDRSRPVSAAFSIHAALVSGPSISSRKSVSSETCSVVTIVRPDCYCAAPYHCCHCALVVSLAGD